MTVSDKYPMEVFRETLDWLARKGCFTTFDMKDCVYKIELGKICTHLTAVRTVV